MGKTTFTGPIEVGKYDTTGATKAQTPGYVVVAKTNTFLRTDTTAKNMFTLPANSQVIDIILSVDAVSDAGTTATFICGKSGSASEFITTGTNLLTATGRIVIGTSRAAVTNWTDIGASDVTMTVTYSETGTASTVGSFRLTVLYAQDNNLS